MSMKTDQNGSLYFESPSSFKGAHEVLSQSRGHKEDERTRYCQRNELQSFETFHRRLESKFKPSNTTYQEEDPNTFRRSDLMNLMKDQNWEETATWKDRQKQSSGSYVGYLHDSIDHHRQAISLSQTQIEQLTKKVRFMQRLSEMQKDKLNKGPHIKKPASNKQPVATPPSTVNKPTLVAKQILHSLYESEMTHLSQELSRLTSLLHSLNLEIQEHLEMSSRLEQKEEFLKQSLNQVTAELQTYRERMNRYKNSVVSLQEEHDFKRQKLEERKAMDRTYHAIINDSGRD